MSEAWINDLVNKHFLPIIGHGAQMMGLDLLRDPEDDYLTIPKTSLPKDHLEETGVSLCVACSGMRMKSLRTRRGYLHSKDFDDFVKSADACRLCFLIKRQLCNAVRFHVQSSETITDPMEALRLFGSFMAAQGLYLVNPTPLILKIDDGRKGIIDQDCVVAGTVMAAPGNGGLASAWNWGRLLLHDNKKDSTRPMKPRGNDQEVLQRLEAWLEQIKAEVPSWSDEAKDRTLPTRVLDLGEPDQDEEGNRILRSDLRLFETHGQLGQYVTLSYSWGGYMGCRTLQSNYRNRMDLISFAELPKTFADAVIVTRGLGVRYLWIDALCIIQEDADDWRREGAAMSEVYWNAVCRLAVTDGKSPTEGFFPPEDILATVEVPNLVENEQSLEEESSSEGEYHIKGKGKASQIIFDDSDGWETVSEGEPESECEGSSEPESQTRSNTGSTNSSPQVESQPREFTQYENNSGIGESGEERSDEELPSRMFLSYPKSYAIDVDRGHLNTRGWVLQERLLAPRTIHFTRDHIYCEDQDDLCGEDWVRRYFTWLSSIHKTSDITQIELFPERSFKSTDALKENVKTDSIWFQRSMYRGSDNQHIQEPWLNICEIFSQCKLSYATDRLFAMLGLVKRKQAYQKDYESFESETSGVRNLLGIRERALHVELAWVARTGRKLTLLHDLNLPSWAWIAYDGRITFTRDRRFSRYPGPVRLPPFSELELIVADVPEMTTMLPLTKPACLKLRVTMRQVHCISHAITKYGMEGESREELAAKSPFYFDENTGTNPIAISTLSDCQEIFDDNRKLIGFVSFDEDPLIVGEYFCAHISTIRDDDKFGILRAFDEPGVTSVDTRPFQKPILAYALILTKVKGCHDSRYRRVGFGELNYDWMINGESETIELV